MLARLSFSFAVVLASAPGIRAEIPLPDVIVYGQLLTEAGAPITSGALRAVVHRADAEVLRVNGEFVAADGEDFFLIRVPMETSLGAPGPTGEGAHEGDSLTIVFGDDERAVELDTPLPPLAAGLVVRSTGRVSGGGGDEPPFFRGDCNADFAVNISDPLALLVFLFQGAAEPRCLRACDSNGDRQVNISDAVYVLVHLFSGGPGMPPPTGACGVDPEPSVEPSCLDPVCP